MCVCVCVLCDRMRERDYSVSDSNTSVGTVNALHILHM